MRSLCALGCGKNDYKSTESKMCCAMVIACLSCAQAVVRGNARMNSRAQVKGGNKVLTPEEQADCLLDQAADGSILGRTWVGWRSWL